MRIVFSVLSLLIVVAVIGFLAKKQLGGSAPVAVPATSGAPSGTPVLTGTPQQQVQQFRQAAEQAVQQPRPMPEDK
jgi:Na+-transporting methylmalonyl-CoA/oxaloacetate decarboxylase gamma subunit